MSAIASLPDRGLAASAQTAMPALR